MLTLTFHERMNSSEVAPVVLHSGCAAPGCTLPVLVCGVLVESQSDVLHTSTSALSGVAWGRM